MGKCCSKAETDAPDPRALAALAIQQGAAPLPKPKSPMTKKVDEVAHGIQAEIPTEASLPPAPATAAAAEPPTVIYFSPYLDTEEKVSDVTPEPPPIDLIRMVERARSPDLPVVNIIAPSASPSCGQEARQSMQLKRERRLVFSELYE
jgi:hypothetical protein